MTDQAYVNTNGRFAGTWLQYSFRSRWTRHPWRGCSWARSRLEMVATRWLREQKALLLLLGSIIAFYFLATRQIPRDDLKPAGLLCDTAAEIEVCAHRGAAPELGFPRPGRNAIRAAWEHKICCFDIDVMQTKDGHLVVAHPRQLQECVGDQMLDPRHMADSYTLQELLDKGIGECDIPKVDSLLEEFSALLKKGIPQRRPMISIELKGSSLNGANIGRILDMAKELSIVQYLYFWFGLESGLDLVRDMKESAPGVHGGLVYKDRDRIQMNTEAEKISPRVSGLYDTIVPSVNLEEALFAEARDKNKTIAVWTINDEEQMWRSMQLGAHYGISEWPLLFRSVVGQALRKCKSHKEREHTRQFMDFAA
ncbi:unnamed protein product [Ostreobium quekettii]|uniref:glycerophosphodiester phosphodiesterase n=1 Tax=Ostreobium quekettii TaxID=121088 RepID=A0A8S1IS76_9CHLO|nr:unnamed protein product [Ostreobium quekettii]|eukprot:evm.model.scf_113.3 EVM.evm.TU.scf_113.3   scf_113:25872-33946(-)